MSFWNKFKKVMIESNKVATVALKIATVISPVLPGEVQTAIDLANKVEDKLQTKKKE